MEEKIKHTAEHIGIISEGALKTLVSEIRKIDMEALIGMLVEKYFYDVNHLELKQLIKDYYEN